jgi:hypothetical protein
LKERITEHFQQALAKVQRRASALRSSSKIIEDEEIANHCFGDEDEEIEEGRNDSIGDPIAIVP